MFRLLAIAIAAAVLPFAAGHGQMMHPPNWFMTDGLPRVCPMTEGASWALGAMGVHAVAARANDFRLVQAHLPLGSAV